jgi:hypothetical protein
VANAARLVVPARSSTSTRQLLSAGAAAGLLPFAVPASAVGSDRLPLGSAAAVTIAATSAAAAEALRHAKRLPADGGAGQRTPKAPAGPPGNAGAGGVAGGAGGAAAGVWCALLLCCVLYLARELRRHRFRLTPPAPSGVVVLLQRPG